MINPFKLIKNIFIRNKDISKPYLTNIQHHDKLIDLDNTINEVAKYLSSKEVTDILIDSNTKIHKRILANDFREYFLEEGFERKDLDIAIDFLNSSPQFLESDIVEIGAIQHVFESFCQTYGLDYSYKSLQIFLRLQTEISNGNFTTYVIKKTILRILKNFIVKSIFKVNLNADQIPLLYSLNKYFDQTFTLKGKKVIALLNQVITILFKPFNDLINEQAKSFRLNIIIV